MKKVECDRIPKGLKDANICLNFTIWKHQIFIYVFTEKEILQFVKREDLTYNERVTKTGKATQKTYGYLTNDIMVADISIPGFITEINLPELYIIKDIDENQRFFEKGDSGSGVFVVGEDQQEKVLGIGIAVSRAEPEAYVCKIDKIVTNLELTLVRYTEDKQKEASPSTESSFN